MGILSPQTALVRYKCVCVYVTSLLPALLLPGISSGCAPAASTPWKTWQSCSSLCWLRNEWKPGDCQPPSLISRLYCCALLSHKPPEVVHWGTFQSNQNHGNATGALVSQWLLSLCWGRREQKKGYSEALGLHHCELVRREAAGCCYPPSHTQWQPVLPAGLFTLTPFATTKAENISHNFCLLFSAEESWFIFTATFHLEKRLPVCVMFLQWQRNTCPPCLQSTGEMWLWRSTAQHIWRHALCWFI